MTRPPPLLFVDDEPRLLDGIRQRLRSLRRDWQPKFFTRAEDAVLELGESESAVVVTDWMMPGMDGLALCRRLTHSEDRERGGRRYVIVLTGKAEVESVVEALGHGADDYVTKPCDMRELVARIETGIRVVGLEDDLRRANQRLRELATTDELTRVSNRRHAADTLSRELQRVLRRTQDLGVVLIDVDHFKKVNDRHGHHAGDLVLKEVAARLKSSVREYDSVARWGGEEFILIIPGASIAEIGVVAERARRSVCTRPVAIDPALSLPISISAGAGSVAAGADLTPEGLLGPIDQALYSAKAAGRNVVHYAELPPPKAPSRAVGT